MKQSFVVLKKNGIKIDTNTVWVNGHILKSCWSTYSLSSWIMEMQIMSLTTDYMLQGIKFENKVSRC